MRKPFVVISGLPGSGKTTLGRRLAPVLNLPLIDKDDILDRLFELKGSASSAARFVQRRRHPGHLDGESSADVLLSLRKLTQLLPLDVGQRIDVDTSHEPNLTHVVRAIRDALEQLT
jgi:uridine kinase